MSEFLRKYWFVSLLAVLFLGVLIYFIADLNKDNVKTLQEDGQDIVVSTDAGNVTSSDLYDASALSSTRLLYNAYRNAVVDQVVEMDSAMEKEAKTMIRNIEANMKADPSGKTKYSILTQLASFGFIGSSAVEDYARMTVKAQKLDSDFIIEHFDQLLQDVPQGARTVSILTMQVDNPTILNDEDTQKKEEIEKALEEKDFAEVAAQYSDDEATKNKKGSYGYIDASSTDLDSELVEAAVALKAGETTEWISVHPSGAQYFVLYKVHVDETDPAKLIASEDEAVVEGLTTSMMNSIAGLEALAIRTAAQSVETTYENDEIKSQVEDYQKTQTQDLADRLGITFDSVSKDSKDSQSESKTDSSSSSEASSSASSAASSTKEGE